MAAATPKSTQNTPTRDHSADGDTARNPATGKNTRHVSDQNLSADGDPYSHIVNITVDNSHYVNICGSSSQQTCAYHSILVC
jgi:hypothetical protein